MQKTFTTGITRRSILKTTATAALITAVRTAFPSGAFAATAAPEVTGAKLGFIALTDAAPLIVAKEKGLFEKHGMKNIVYCTPIEKDGKPVGDKLVYLLAHKSLEAAQASFAAFGKDPEWVAAREASEKDGKIVAKVESQFLVPTDYSPMK